MSTSISKTIEKLMIDNNLTQKDLAELSGLTEAAISNYLSKKRNPNKTSLSKIAKALNTTVENLQSDVTKPASLATLAFTLSSVAMLSPIGMISSMTGMAVGLSVNAKKNNRRKSNDILLDFEKELKRFKNNSIGEIHDKLESKHINFVFNSDKNDEKENKPDYSLFINDNQINSWWFIFWKESSKLNSLYNISKKERAALLVSKFVMTKPDKHRKSSIVVNDIELYNEIIKFDGNLSYKGNLSVILFDEKEMLIISERNISVYDDTINNLISLI